MKKYLFTMATAAMLFASCSSDDTVVVDNGANEEGLVEIKLGSRGVESRVVEAITDLKNLSVGIFAADRTSMAEEDVYLKNIEGVASEAAEGVYSIALQSADNSKYYYPSTAATYDFFGYYPYSEDEESVTYGDKIVATGTFTKALDILAGRAAQVTDAQAGFAWSADYYKKHRTAGTTATDPSIEFNHMNSRFVIEIKRGPAFVEETCVLNSVKMDLPETYELIFANGTNPTIDYKNTVEEDVVVVEGSYTALEGDEALKVVDFMVPSGKESHRFDLYFTNRAAKSPVTINFTDVEFEDKDQVTETKFEPGKIYTITLTINGPEEITVKATLKEWAEGGNFGVEI